MSMISEQIQALRNVALAYRSNGLGLILNDAANTIEELSAKLASANMDRSEQFYNDAWIPCSERLPEETEEDLSGDYLDHLDELIERGVFKPYLVTIEGAKVPTELYYVGSCGEVLWYDEITEEFYKVIAWQELPKAYRPKGE